MKHYPLRLQEDKYEKLRREATALNTSVNDLINIKINKPLFGKKWIAEISDEAEY